MRNPIAQGLRNAVVKFTLSFSQQGHRAANTLAEPDIGYPHSPLSADGVDLSSKTKAGVRWPDRLPPDPGKACFTAVGPAAVASELATKFPQLGAGRAHRPKRHQGPHLVRSDGYVGFAGAATDRAGAYLLTLAS